MPNSVSGFCFFGFPLEDSFILDLSLSFSSQADATGMQQKTCRDTDVSTRYGLNYDARTLVALPHCMLPLGTHSRV